MKNAQLPLALIAVLLLAPGAAEMHGQAATSMPKPGNTPQLVILDTDIGDDIDDAFALALVLRSPELELLGVTTTFGDTELRAQLLDRYLKAVGRTGIPVAAGSRTPANNTFTQRSYALQVQDQSKAHRLVHPNAVNFLFEQIRAHPGEITVIAIGPLFNIQAAIARDPETFRKLKRVVIMGGSIYRGYDGEHGEKHSPPSPEWNIFCDPAGARALFASGVPVFVMPLDSTQIHLENPALGSILAHGSPLTDQLTLLYHQWTGASEWRSPTLFDPVAVTYAIRPDLCPATPMRLEVDDKGFTKPVPGSPNAKVCLQSDQKGFLDFLIARITADHAE